MSKPIEATTTSNLLPDHCLTRWFLLASSSTNDPSATKKPKTTPTTTEKHSPGVDQNYRYTAVRIGLFGGVVPTRLCPAIIGNTTPQQGGEERQEISSLREWLLGSGCSSLPSSSTTSRKEDASSPKVPDEEKRLWITQSAMRLLETKTQDDISKRKQWVGATLEYLHLKGPRPSWKLINAQDVAQAIHNLELATVRIPTSKLDLPPNEDGQLLHHGMQVWQLSPPDIPHELVAKDFHSTAQAFGLDPNDDDVWSILRFAQAKNESAKATTTNTPPPTNKPDYGNLETLHQFETLVATWDRTTETFTPNGLPLGTEDFIPGTYRALQHVLQHALPRVDVILDSNGQAGSQSSSLHILVSGKSLDNPEENEPIADQEVGFSGCEAAYLDTDIAATIIYIPCLSTKSNKESSGDDISCLPIAIASKQPAVYSLNESIHGQPLRNMHCMAHIHQAGSIVVLNHQSSVYAIPNSYPGAFVVTMHILKPRQHRQWSYAPVPRSFNTGHRIMKLHNPSLRQSLSWTHSVGLEHSRSFVRDDFSVGGPSVVPGWQEEHETLQLVFWLDAGYSLKHASPSSSSSLIHCNAMTWEQSVEDE